MTYKRVPRQFCKFCQEDYAIGQYRLYHGTKCKKYKIKIDEAPWKNLLNTYLGQYETLIDLFASLHNNHIRLLEELKIKHALSISKNIKDIRVLCNKIKSTNYAMRQQMRHDIDLKIKIKKIQKEERKNG